LLGLKRQFGDLHECSEFSSNLAQRQEMRNEKTQSVFVISEEILKTVKQDDLPVNLTGTRHLPSQVLSKSKEQCQSDETTSEFITNSVVESLDESNIEKFSPNESGRATVSRETSSETFFENKGAESTKDLATSHTSQFALSDEISMSDFMVNSQTSSESVYEARGDFGKSHSLTPTPDLESKRGVLKRETFIIEKAAGDVARIASSRSNKMRQGAATLKPHNDKSLNVLQLPLS